MAGDFKDHFSSHAADYAAYRPHYPPELAFRLAELAPGRGLALDCGCGAGQLSVLLAEHFETVVATDPSAEQIAHATPHERVTYRVAKAEDSGLPEHGADLVTAAQAAHWFDLDAFYREARRVLRPAGVIALVTYGVIEAEGRVGEVIGRFYHEVLASHWPPERRHVEAGYRSLPFPFDELAVQPSEMTALWTVDQLLGYVDTWSAVRMLEARQGREPYEAFAAELREAWGDPATPRLIRWPLGQRIGRL